MATLDFKPPRTKAEPELNLLLPKSAEQPLWKSLFQNLDDYFFPKKQPPLVLTSKPVPVKDIWGFYDYKKSGVVGSTVVHVLTIAAIVGLTIAGRHVVQEVTKKQEVVTYVARMTFLLCPRRRRSQVAAEEAAIVTSSRPQRASCRNLTCSRSPLPRWWSAMSTPS